MAESRYATPCQPHNLDRVRRLPGRAVLQARHKRRPPHNRRLTRFSSPAKRASTPGVSYDAFRVPRAAAPAVPHEARRSNRQHPAPRVRGLRPAQGALQAARGYRGSLAPRCAAIDWPPRRSPGQHGRSGASLRRPTPPKPPNVPLLPPIPWPFAAMLADGPGLLLHTRLSRACRSRSRGAAWRRVRS